MKLKKLSKKLTLNKSTVAHLDSNKMSGVKGGWIPTDPRFCYISYPLPHTACTHTCPL